MLDEFKKVHKKALGYLVLFSELEKQNASKNIFDTQAIFYLKESVSDVLQSIFVWVNGAYKGADLLLRSSIENFNKAMIGNESMSVVLHRVYGELCKSTHSATTADMDHVTALNLLPKYERTKTQEYRKYFEVLIDAYLGFFLANYKEVVDGMYRGNADIFYEVISRNVIRSVVNG